jgi:type IV pilus assembly protein PilV
MGLRRNVVALRRRTGGFTLLEVLVALVVIAVGMLGIAVMYVEGMKAQRTSIYRNHAVNLVADLVERIRANVDAGGAYAGAGAVNGCTNGFSDCTPAELAQEDLWSWQRDVGERLPPGAAGTVFFLPAGQTQRYTIGVTWPEAGLPAPQTYAVTIELGHGAGVASP